MKFRWWDKAPLLVLPPGCGRKQRRVSRTKCFGLMPVNSPTEGKSHVEVQFSQSKAVRGDKRLC